MKLTVIHQFEAELTLGNLFRSRGEVDRALRIHQALDNSPNYTFEQKLLAKQQLARDFMAVGFFDRAEHLYILMVDEPEFAEGALQQLAVIYQKTKEWKKAINVAEKLAKISPNSNRIELAHYYCEYVQNLPDESKEDPKQILLQALKVSPNCVRASIMLADLYIKQKEYKSAVDILENILTQNATYIGEVLHSLKFCYQQLNQLDNFELFLIKASRENNNSAVALMLADLIEEKDGRAAAQLQLYQQLQQNPATLIFHRFIQYQINDAEKGRGKDSLILLHKMVGERIKQTFGYRCRNCGYQTHKLIWCCPSCRQWETIKPVSSIEHN